MTDKPQKLIFNRREAQEYLCLKETKFARFIAEGAIPKSIKKKGQHPYWTIRQLRLAARQIHDLDNPKPTRTIDPNVRGHSAKQIEQMRRNLGYGGKIS